MMEPDEWLENGVVEVSDGRITNVEGWSGREAVVDHGPGVILPALINAHAHLGLSALRGKIDSTRGFVNWVSELIAARAELKEQETWNAALDGAISVKNSGTGFVAEVGTARLGASVLRESGLQGIVFEEVLGACPHPPPLPKASDGLVVSYAGHALHTTGPDALRWLKAATGDSLFSIHLAEADAEVEFLATGKGVWAELLIERGIDFSDWGPWGERPIARAYRLGLLGPRTLAVHTLHADAADMETLAATGTSVCLCPRSNWELHGRLPKIGAMLRSGLTCALGSDSSASCPSLSLFDEMAFVSERYPELSPGTILALATVHGARAVGREDLGRIRSGCRARLIYVDLFAGSAAVAASKLVFGPIGTVEWL
jgi:cytosine/adenosine deaminase-related metal-dependent hydrolase